MVGYNLFILFLSIFSESAWSSNQQRGRVKGQKFNWGFKYICIYIVFIEYFIKYIKIRKSSKLLGANSERKRDIWLNSGYYELRNKL